MERVLLVTVGLDSNRQKVSLNHEAKELRELAQSTGAFIVSEFLCFRDKLTPNLYIGKGKVGEIGQLCQEEKIGTIIFNNDLSGTQQRNLEDILNIKTIDRSQLILDIFARHAKTPEGNMQVELAQLEYMLPRLTGKGIILSRLGGGIGTSGPGEQKLEVDRRRIREHIARLKKDLEGLTERRKTIKKKRKESSVPTVTIIGYTSSGKSTLLNSLSGSKQKTSKHLFTTLDPLSRSLELPNHQKIVLSDTVGFINNLPPHLIEAFKATLEEVVDADLLIHVLDISHPRFIEHNKAVYDVLGQLEAMEKPVITVFNKIDLLNDKSWLGSLGRDFPDAVAISALNKENISKLLEKIQEKFSSLLTILDLFIPLNRMDLVDFIYHEGEVISIDYTTEGAQIQSRLPLVTAKKLSAYCNKP